MGREGMSKAKPLEEITRKDFQRYERVRREGLWNMFSPQAREATGLSRETYLGVIKHYEELMKKFPDVRKVEEE